MILIIDSGATKAEWRAVREDGSGGAGFRTTGMNLSAMPAGAVLATAREAAGHLQEYGPEMTQIHFYAAGLPSDQLREGLQETFRKVMPRAAVDIQSDLLGAARAVCGRKSGIAAILGTGSGAMLYDGEKIVRRVASGGYVLGDEGSAAALGRLFLSDWIKGLVPEDLRQELEGRCTPAAGCKAENDETAGTERCGANAAGAPGTNLSYEGIVHQVYRSEAPSGYLGSFAPFLLEHYTHPYVRELVDGNFRAFFRRCLLPLGASGQDSDPGAAGREAGKRSEDIPGSLPVGVTGGFGCAAQEILTRLAAEEGIRITRFQSSPIEGLVHYHTVTKQAAPCSGTAATDTRSLH